MSIIVDTNVLELGIDVLNIRMVVHVGSLFNLMNYRQELERAGYDGRKSEAIVVMTKKNILSKFKDTEEKLMWKYLQI